jgi:hypothetical protein
MPQPSRRTTGHVVFVGQSRSAKFWAIVKDAQGERHFAYGRNWLGAEVPRAGWPVSFTPLPPGSGRMPRATEIAVLPRSKRALASQIMVVHDDGALRVMLRQGQMETALGELHL